MVFTYIIMVFDYFPAKFPIRQIFWGAKSLRQEKCQARCMPAVQVFTRPCRSRWNPATAKTLTQV